MSDLPIFLPAPDVATMTSLELVGFINDVRAKKAEQEGKTFPCKNFPELLHKNFIAKVPKVLGLSSAKFLADDTFTTGKGAANTRKIYKFPRREACLMAMSYDYDAQARVFDRMDELEGRINVNFMDFSAFKTMTIAQMQTRVTLAERYSFEEHGQKGSGLMQLRKKEKRQIRNAEDVVNKLSQLELPGFEIEMLEEV
ncbi:Rha family transcriptional regulator [Pantoea sp. ICBG 1758]|uniref:Rha family transcriptional regulator n=1 Tax=Pantoea sp. ICBG 1758 TaxID=2071682 RepID=UPI000CE3E63F|nr:Rha family transcriptional regulator [Pantoea sp. ICBG 1758]PPC63906.1 Rha family transcriptional regulator [Pantoea sp. ICBG 1758]